MGRFIGWTLYLVFLVAIVLVGWEQPLKAQFGFRPTPPSPAAVVAPQPKTAASPSWMNDNQRWDNRRPAP